MSEEKKSTIGSGFSQTTETEEEEKQSKSQSSEEKKQSGESSSEKKEKSRIEPTKTLKTDFSYDDFEESEKDDYNGARN